MCLTRPHVSSVSHGNGCEKERAEIRGGDIESARVRAREHARKRERERERERERSREREREGERQGERERGRERKRERETETETETLCVICHTWEWIMSHT